MVNKTTNSVVIASQNSGKIAELQNLLANKYQVITLDNYSNTQIDESASTFIENALLKARACCDISNLPAIADDSGICVPYLNNKPGLYSARYSQIDDDYKFNDNLSVDANNNCKLLQLLQTADNRDAFYYCCLVFLRSADDASPLIAEGRWYGKIAMQPKGDNGFGYDPIFVANGFSISAAQLQLAEKQKLSHRAKAMQTLLRLIEN